MVMTAVVKSAFCIDESKKGHAALCFIVINNHNLLITIICNYF
jgi:hypothetical protein